MNWPKSRYTASLEAQILELKTDKKRLQEQLDTLLRERTEAHVRTGMPDKKTDKPEQSLPTAVNWLRARGSLESTDLKITEGKRDKETANGSR